MNGVEIGILTLVPILFITGALFPVADVTGQLLPVLNVV
jgi:hypothetical protein